jgi:hypothetical protein
MSGACGIHERHEICTKHFWFEIPKEGNNLGDQRVDGKITLTIILKKLCVSINWIQLARDRLL